MGIRGYIIQKHEHVYVLLYMLSLMLGNIQQDVKYKQNQYKIDHNRYQCKQTCACSSRQRSAQTKNIKDI